MTDNITELVNLTIEKDPVIKVGLSRRLITPRSLAQYMTEKNPDYNLEALRTAIRRALEGLESMDEHNAVIKRFLRDAKIHLKSGVVKVAFQKGDASLELINKSLRAMDIYASDTFRLVKGHDILHILVDESNLNKIQEFFSERIIGIEKDICEITIALHKDSYTQYGIWASIINEIAMSKISLVETFSCGTEINLFVKENDKQKAFLVLTDMINRVKEER